MTGTTPQRLRALILSHEDAGGSGFIEECLVDRGIDVHMHVILPDFSRPDAPAPFPDHREFDLIVVMGSYYSVYDEATIGSWVGDEIEIIRTAHEAGQPVLGICFGGQALASALGGSVQEGEVTELGWFEIEPTNEPLPISSGPWLEWHHDCFTPPPGAQVVAQTVAAPQMFRIRKSLGTQFHPEINTELLTEWLQKAPDEYLAEQQVTRSQLMADLAVHEQANRKNCHDLVDWFLEEVAELTTPGEL
ncbi:MAG: GMP synthase-like glutamine amidotransferase [Candidatus Poriferisodalaceae bacterium]|jgi:GMP synthase-like glutamine amidotransferase